MNVEETMWINEKLWKFLRHKHQFIPWNTSFTGSWSRFSKSAYIALYACIHHWIPCTQNLKWAFDFEVSWGFHIKFRKTEISRNSWMIGLCQNDSITPRDDVTWLTSRNKLYTVMCRKIFQGSHWKNFKISYIWFKSYFCKTWPIGYIFYHAS